MSRLTDTLPTPGMTRNVRLYPWFKFLQNLIFWLAIWFLFFQERLSAAEALVLYAIYDLTTTLLEVPSGYLSDLLGRRRTLIASAALPLGAMGCFIFGDSFLAFAVGQALLGAGGALMSGADSAFLYESLKANWQEADVEHHEVRAWRFGFAGFAVSAAIGGAVGMVSYQAVFAMTAVAMALAGLVAFYFTEPPQDDTGVRVTETMRLKSLRRALSQPVLVWLFAVSVLMWAFGHIPFVFGQPFILDALAGVGFDGQAPLVSGVVTTTMMLISLVTSLFAPRLRHRFGLPAIVCFSFGMQVFLAAVLAATNSPIAIAMLFLRMVPGSLSAPFIVARIQPLVSDESRATFLSIRSLGGRLLLVAMVWFASFRVATEGAMTHDELQSVLVWFVALGVASLLALIITARRLPIDGPA